MRSRLTIASLITAVAVAGCGTSGVRPDQQPETLAARSSSDQKIGDQNHSKIVQQYGGTYKNAKVTNYVTGIGNKLASVSEQPDAKWTFTVLDTPTVNAFALPGGYVYVTRGLLGLAEDEAELAGVLGHEIGHVTAGHSSLRQDRSTAAGVGLLVGSIGLGLLGVGGPAAQSLMTLGQTAAGGILADYSRGDELDADNLGIRYLAKAGYDPYAQADFLDSLGAASQLDAKIAGRGYNPNSVDFFASHPANAPRTRQAIQVAEKNGLAVDQNTDRGQARYLSIIDGLPYGDSPDQGFVDGRNFSHPKLRFAFSAPPGFAITNSSNAVVARGPQNALFIMDGGKDPGGDLTNYIKNGWVPALAKQTRVGQLRQLQSTKINGLPAALGILPMAVKGGTADVELVAIRLNGTVYRFTGIVPRGSNLLPEIDQAARSFRQLSAAEARNLKGKQIKVVTVGRGDTVASLSKRMKVDQFAEERFLVLNGMKAGDQVKAGQKVKLIQ
ncbi:M48 family metalloprotease [Rhodobacteraceae bacterium NNCM2]|nr:M48 family metalloprotease [Coraliihabitans acroporae]